MIDKISLYRSFACVARSGSISAAAKELFVTQPAVSSDILALERELGVSLFSRTNRGMKLTPEGNVLYGYIREAFAFIESGEDALRDITGLHSGIIRIGASDMTLKFYLLDYIEAFRKKHPDIRLSITNNPTPKTGKLTSALSATTRRTFPARSWKPSRCAGSVIFSCVRPTARLPKKKRSPRKDCGNSRSSSWRKTPAPDGI